MSSLSLVFGVHCHQPVGQDPAIVERAADDCYLPFLKAMEEHSRFKFCAHFSGALLMQMESIRPTMIDLIKTLIHRGQMEILGGGIYEPILMTLTESDRSGQIRRFSDYLQRLFGPRGRPKGMWPAEQVWEPNFCGHLRGAQIQYVMLSGHQFAAAGVGDAGTWGRGVADPTGEREPANSAAGTYQTEDAGHVITIFPIDEELRASMMAKPVDDVMGYLKSRAANSGEFPGNLLTLMSDGENFGGRDEDRLKKFLDAVERSDFLNPLTPSEWMSTHEPRALVYIPTSAGAEISERRGGWRSFLTEYPESNWMQKRVFLAAAKMGPVLEKLGADRESRAIRDLLDRAACNDAYWPGASGGLYMPHLRLAIFENLLESENRFSKKMGLFPACFSDDLDADGMVELMVYTEHWVLGFKPGYGAGLVEWSFRPACYNFQNTVTRRPERQHRVLRQKPKRRILIAGEIPDETHAGQDGPEGLIYDRYQKCTGLLYALDPQASFEDFKKQSFAEIVPATGRYEWKVEDKPESFGIRFRRPASETPALGAAERLSRPAGRPEISFEKDIVISKHESRLSIRASMDTGGADRGARLAMGLEFFYVSGDDLSVRVMGAAAADEPPAVSPYAGGAGGGLEADVQGRGLEIVDRAKGTRMELRADQDVRFWMAPSCTVTAARASATPKMDRPASAGVGDASTWGAGGADPGTPALGAAERLSRIFQGLSMMVLPGLTPIPGRQEIGLRIEVKETTQ